MFSYSFSVGRSCKQKLDSDTDALASKRLPVAHKYCSQYLSHFVSSLFMILDDSCILLC